MRIAPKAPRNLHRGSVIVLEYLALGEKRQVLK